MNRLEGKTAIVTGASRGIGLAIAERLVDEGANVIITARGEDALKEAVAGLGERASYVAGKADDPAHREEVVRTAIDKHGSIDVLINNTGINPVFGKLLDVEPEVSRKILEVNVLSALEWVKLVHKAWMQEHGGSIVNVASVAGLRPAPGIAMYGVSKAAVIHLTEELAIELGPDIRVNAVAPAVVKTKFAEALYSGREEQVAKPYPLKRLGEPEDIGSVVAFLASDDSGWMTGQTLTVDGGVLLNGGV
ncbi:MULTISPECIES: SDR family oxidoreductase [Yimella]|uniref:NAD(P)-dependent dehydrogenase (Short-subunit alcohol dehydrogenase family) n=1 Tax=Yimella lutea TaxID=587872 RepID=A0A542EDW4_9MICO|nr:MULTISPECIES: SDR family oxidoreductase [Yimella]MCG8656236.1 SDR family oxidoreductase [Yimella sp. NH-Cas1]TQJ13521.1 NAD(P)-dependent dehydrogenase (short-subunit alcohol dehydrogenase family) [Yimella lutea]